MDDILRNKIKEYLNTSGPIIASVWLSPHQTDGSYVESHVVAIIGYDDIKAEYIFVNSFGDHYGNNGISSIPYSNFLDSSPFHQMNSGWPQIISIQKIVNQPTSLMGCAAARIKIGTSVVNVPSDGTVYGRNALTIKLGVSARTIPPKLVVWDRNNSFARAGIGLVNENDLLIELCKNLG